MNARIATACCIALFTGSAWAGDCWVATAENRGTGLGDAITAKRHAGLLAVLHRAEAALKADPAINAIAKVRYQAHLYIGAPYHAGAPKSGSVSAFLHKPDAWSGRCGLKPWADNVHFVQMEVVLNDLIQLGTRADIGGGDLSDVKFFYPPKRIGERDGHPIYENDAGNRVLVMTAGNQPPFVPVTVGEYLDDWQARLKLEREEARRNLSPLTENQDWNTYIAALRKTDPKGAAELEREMAEAARLAREGDPGSNDEWQALQRLRKSLTAAQRAQPAYLSAAAMEHQRFGLARPGDAEASALVKINPALWAGTGDESEVRTVALQVLVQDGDGTRTSGADRWLERVDVRPYRALLTGVKR